jgi:hypothetical protein
LFDKHRYIPLNVAYYEESDRIKVAAEMSALSKEGKGPCIDFRLQKNKGYQPIEKKDNSKMFKLACKVLQLGKQMPQNIAHFLFDRLQCRGPAELMEFVARFEEQQKKTNSKEQAKAEAKPEKSGKEARKCHKCGKQGAKLCAGCKLVAYCSPTCQKADWADHKKSCKK